MIVTTVHVRVKKEHIEEFIRVTRENHEQSVREKGNIRFDVLRNREKDDEFLLYEAYEDEATAAAHKKTTHYLTWRAKVEPWMAAPRRGVRYNGICP